jgi:hypothetical protein
MIWIYDRGVIRHEYSDADTAKDRAGKTSAARGQSGESRLI